MKSSIENSDISFLIGSGFSIPAGYPSLGTINSRLGNIKPEEISVHSSGATMFLNGAKDVNAEISGVEERAFIHEFIDFYVHAVIPPGGVFNYEDFYDYYMSLYRDATYSEADKQFFIDFKKRHRPLSDDQSLLMNFHHSFNQLIAQMLHKREERAHICKPYIPPHDRFLALCDALKGYARIHFHTLNHDLLLDSLAVSDAILDELDDGFEELGSPYFGRIWGRYETLMVRLPYFTNRFSSRFRLYKLHGSIDFYWFAKDGHETLVKMRQGVGTNELFKEVKTGNGLAYLNDTSNYYPDFLAGRNTKQKRYPMGSYYPTIFEHFRNNLENSDALITIGYGFGDAGINEILESCILEKTHKILIVVDVHPPTAELLAHANVSYVPGGVEGMSVAQVVRLLR